MGYFANGRARVGRDSIPLPVEFPMKRAIVSKSQSLRVRTNVKAGAGRMDDWEAPVV